MLRSKPSQREQKAVNQRRGPRVAIALAVVLSLFAACAMLVHSGTFDSASSEKRKKEQGHSVTPASLDSNSPAAKEYVYAGGRLIVSEEPNAFSACLVDDSNAGNVVLLNTSTGDFRFCCNGVTAASGRGTVTVISDTVNIHQVKGDRTVDISVTSTGQGSGSATVQKSGRGVICQINDSSMTGDACTCP